MGVGRHRKSHTVSKFYLRAFAKDGHIVALKSRRAQRIGVGLASVERDCYALRMDDGSLYQGFEDRLSDAETAAAPGHRMLVDGQMPSGAVWLNYLLYLALAVGRSRRGWEMSASAVPAELREIASHRASTEGQRLYLQNLFRRIAPRCAWLFGQLDVRVTPLPADLRFMTADHPVGLWTEAPDAVDTVGLLSADLIVHPISRHRALWFKKPADPWPDWLNDPWSVAGNANWAMSKSAVEEVYFHPEDAGRILLWLPNGRSRTSLGTSSIPVARALPLWVPTRPPPRKRDPETLERSLVESPRMEMLSLVARETGFRPEEVLAADMPNGPGPWAALVNTAQGFSIISGEVRARAA